MSPIRITVDVTNVDWARFRRQKLELLRVIAQGGAGDFDSLNGLANFLDAVQSHAANQLGDEAVYGVCEDCGGSGYTGDYAGPNTAEFCGCGSQNE